MRENTQSSNFSTNPSLGISRNPYSQQQATNFMRTQGPKYYAPMYNNNNNKSIHPVAIGVRIAGQTQESRDFIIHAQAMNGSFFNTNNNEGRQIQTRNNSIDYSESKNSIPIDYKDGPLPYCDRKIEQTQREIDLRGSCPNIFRKMEQNTLRNTTHLKGPYKFNVPFNIGNNSNSNEGYIQPQPPVHNFLKYHGPNNNAPYGSAVTSSVMVLESNSKEQTLNRNNYPTSKSSIGANSKGGLNAFMASKLNANYEILPENFDSSNNNLSAQKTKTHFKTLSDVTRTKSHKVSMQLNDQDLSRFLLSSFKQSKIIGQFQIGKILGKGKFGQVFLGRHKNTGLVVALKRIIKSKVREQKMIDQLKDQIKIHSSLNHPNIIRFFGCFQDGDDIYLVLEYMNRGTLFDYLADRQRLSIRETVDFLRDIISALQYMHDKSIAHRDIKPENIVLSTEGVAKLCDFGWAAVVEGSRKTYCGTFDYAPPEILERKDYDSSVDLWCLGVLTYQLLTGKAPFEGQVRNQIMQKIINVPHISIQIDKTGIQYPVQIPLYARDFIQSLVKKDPCERPKCKDLLKHQLFIQNPSTPIKKK